MLIHLAGWTINRRGARVVKKQRFLNISLVWIRYKQKGRDPVHTSYENTEAGGLEVGISKNDGEVQVGTLKRQRPRDLNQQSKIHSEFQVLISSEAPPTQRGESPKKRKDTGDRKGENQGPGVVEYRYVSGTRAPLLQGYTVRPKFCQHSHGFVSRSASSIDRRLQEVFEVRTRVSCAPQVF